MKLIESFKVDHTRLLPGIYVSRKDDVNGNVVTTFDIRVCRPNFEPAMNTAEVHAIEHLGATFVRNDPEWQSKVIYFGPMGCRTGFYLILTGDLKSTDIYDLVKNMFTFIRNYDSDIPGATPDCCGNYLDFNLPMASYYAEKFANEVLNNFTPEHYTYPA